MRGGAQFVKKKRVKQSILGCKQGRAHLKLIRKLEPKLARLEVTVAAGTVSDRGNLLWAGGLSVKYLKKK